MSIKEIYSGHKQPIIPTKKEVQAKEPPKNEDIDKVTVTGETSTEEIDPKAVIESLKEGKIDSIKDFVAKNSTWGAFAAGILAGLADRSKGTEYLEQVKADMQKMLDNQADCAKVEQKNAKRYRVSNKLKNISSKLLGGVLAGTATLGLVVGFLPMVVGFASQDFSELMFGVVAMSPAAIDASVGGAFRGLSKLLKPKKMPELKINDPQFRPLDNGVFVTIPPGSKKVLICGIEKDEDTGEIYPEIKKSIELPEQPVSLSEVEKKDDIEPDYTQGYFVKINYDKPLLSKLRISVSKSIGKEIMNSTITHRDLSQNKWDDFEKETQ